MIQIIKHDTVVPTDVGIFYYLKDSMVILVETGYSGGDLIAWRYGQPGTIWPVTADDGLYVQADAEIFILDSLNQLVFCPACHKQHVDKPEPCRMCDGTGKRSYSMPGIFINGAECSSCNGTGQWTNPPHKSHTCHYCGKVFRLADFPTNGVAVIQTVGKDDTWKNVS